MPGEQTTSRKLEHIKIVLEKNTTFKQKVTGFHEVELIYKTLPEMDLSEVDTTINFLGKKFNAPLIVSGMTGGVKEAESINRDIAAGCEEIGIGFGVGSQRAMIENPSLKSTYQVREVAPSILVAGNIGASQLKNYGVAKIQEMLDAIGADCLAIHTNAAQEAVQDHGTPQFKGVLDQIRKFNSELNVPVYVKEVGNGLSKESAFELSKTGIPALDVGGSGGTSWTGIEYIRAQNAESVYWDFGIPTSLSILEAKSAFNREIIATGGIRNGLEVVKALVLGASLAGIAAPIIRAQHREGQKGVVKTLEKLIHDIRIGMFLLGARNVDDLRNAHYVLLGKSREWALERNLK